MVTGTWRQGSGEVCLPGSGTPLEEGAGEEHEHTTSLSSLVSCQGPHYLTPTDIQKAWGPTGVATAPSTNGRSMEGKLGGQTEVTHATVLVGTKREVGSTPSSWKSFPAALREGMGVGQGGAINNGLHPEPLF